MFGFLSLSGQPVKYFGFHSLSGLPVKFFGFLSLSGHPVRFFGFLSLSGQPVKLLLLLLLFFTFRTASEVFWSSFTFRTAGEFVSCLEDLQEKCEGHPQLASFPLQESITNTRYMMDLHCREDSHEHEDDESNCDHPTDDAVACSKIVSDSDSDPCE